MRGIGDEGHQRSLEHHRCAERLVESVDGPLKHVALKKMVVVDAQQLRALLDALGDYVARCLLPIAALPRCDRVRVRAADAWDQRIVRLTVAGRSVGALPRDILGDGDPASARKSLRPWYVSR